MSHFPKAYLRMDPNLDQHPDFAGMVLLMCAANRQPRRGRFEPAVVYRLLGRRRARPFLEPRPGKPCADLVEMPDGTLYLDGWEEWQEGDLTVGERVARLRAKRNRTVTPPLPGRKRPSRASGVRHQALGEGMESSKDGEEDAGSGAPSAARPPTAGGTSSPSPGHGPIPHAPEDPLQALVAARCRALAQLVATAEGREATDADVLEVLRCVSTTPGGGCIDDLRGVSEPWLRQTLRACDAFEADHTEAEP